MSHRNLPDATRRPTPRLGTSPRPCFRCAHRWLSWRLPKSPLLPPRRAAWRLGQGVRRRIRRTTKTTQRQSIRESGGGPFGVSLAVSPNGRLGGPHDYSTSSLQAHEGRLAAHLLRRLGHGAVSFSCPCRL